MVHKLKLILAEGNINSLGEFHYVIRELKMHALTDIMRNATDPLRKDWAAKLMSQEFNMGGAPYVDGSEAAKRHFNETMQVVDRAFRDTKGFGGVALDCRGLPRSTRYEPVPPLMVRFGLDSAERTCIVNSSSNDRFPGKGFYVEGLDTHKLFSTDPRWKEKGKSSPHWRWLEGKGLFAGDYFRNFDMEGLSECGFLKVRGVEVVFPPRSQRNVLDGTLYAYLFYNRHFAPFPQVALGVPVVVLQDLLGSALIPAEDYRGFDPKRTDLSKVDLSYPALLKACKRRGLNLLDLTYGSVIGGGLCNVYLPESDPHYRWQLEVGDVPVWKDTWGHVHKSWLEYASSRKGQTSDQRLRFARVLQGDVLEAFRSLQDYASAFRFGYSFYKMGTTLIKASDVRGDSNEPGDADFSGSQFDEARVHEYRFRMLEETYRWHWGAKEQRWRHELFPELHYAWVLDPNSLPPQSQRRFHIDLATMVLKTKNGSFQLPKDGDGLGDDEREIWTEQVVPHFENNSVGWEPRFLMRNGAFTIHE